MARSRPGGDRPGKSPEELAAIYDDAAARFERFDRLQGVLLGRYRRRVFGPAAGRVLDVACGTGANFRYLGDVDVVGVDLSPAMLAGARRTADRLGRSATLLRADAARLPFPDDSFDSVVSALSTCTFPDPVAALREMARVCRPGGSIRLLEHGRSAVGPLAALQDRFADRHFESMGCRWNQRPAALVEAAGLRPRERWRSALGVLTGVVADPAVT
jgi:ubiquinone/menaquinone biosynthesis C-methylase UbiE